MEKLQGKARVTIKDVAKASGVSIATVSYVLNNKPGQSISDETRKKVLQFANILGYECNVMAKYLATGKTNAVTAVVKSFNALSSGYYVNLLAKLSVLLAKKGFDLKLADYADSLERSIACDAYVTFALSEADFRAFADTKYAPVIAVDSMFDDFLFYRINDDYSALYARAKQASGADKIALIAPPLDARRMEYARSVFDSVVVIDGAADMQDLDRDTVYVAAAQLPPELIVGGEIKLCTTLPDTSEQKAQAAVDAVLRAIGRENTSPEQHDIRV